MTTDPASVTWLIEPTGETAIGDEFGMKTLEQVEIWVFGGSLGKFWREV
jgi:hypothetical protein